MLDDVSGLMPWSQRLQVGLAALMLFSMLGWLLLDLLRSRAQVTRVGALQGAGHCPGKQPR